jgi:hypothetical protein
MFSINRATAMIICCLFLMPLGGLEAAEKEHLGSACLRDFPEIYTLQTEGLKADERLTQARSLLAAKFNLAAEVVAKALAKEAELKLQEPTSSKLNRARALFTQRSFVEAETLAIAAGDESHRSTPRRVDDMIASLRLAAYSAMEQQLWEPAIKYLSVAITEINTQKDLSSWAALQVGIAHAQKNLGMLDEYERTRWFIFHEHEQRLGADTVETLHHQNELAACLYERGKDAEAEKQIRLILQATLKIRGNDHADTQVTRKNLARLLEGQQKFAEAELLRRDVCDAQNRQLGGEALTTLKSLEQWIQNLMSQKKFGIAEVEANALVKKAEQSLGKDSPITLTGRALEVAAIVAQEKFEPALSMASSLVSDASRVLGSDHVITLKAQFCEASCLNQLKRYQEALPILTSLLKARQLSLPANDDDLLATHHQLSMAYLGLEKRQESLDHLRIALTSYEKKYGPADLRTQAANQTANILVNSEEGKRILIDERREAFAKTSAKLGANHPQTLAEQYGMATFIAGLGLAKEALKEHSLALAGRRKKLGSTDLQTLESLRAVALLEMDMQQFADSELHLRELLGKRQKLLKPTDPAVQESRYHLGLCLGRAGKLGESIALVESSYLAVKDQDGVNQPFVAQMKAVLDQLYTLTAPKPTNFDGLSVPAPLTVQQAPNLVPVGPASATAQGLPHAASGPALPNPATLVPGDSIQKHIQVKP